MRGICFVSSKIKQNQANGICYVIFSEDEQMTKERLSKQSYRHHSSFVNYK